MHGLLRETGAAGALAKVAVTLALTTLGACNGNIGDHAKPPVVITTPQPLCNGLDPGPSFIRRVNRLELVLDFLEQRARGLVELGARSEEALA